MIQSTRVDIITLHYKQKYTQHGQLTAHQHNVF